MGNFQFIKKKMYKQKENKAEDINMYHNIILASEGSLAKDNKELKKWGGGRPLVRLNSHMINMMSTSNIYKVWCNKYLSKYRFSQAIRK